MVSQFEHALLFKCIVDQQSFAKAAEHSGLTPSAVSKRLAKLEASLGTQLIHRTTRRLALTEAGEYFYEKVARLQHEWTSTWDETASLNSELRGTLRIAAPQTVLCRFLMPLLVKFRRTYPAITFELLHRDIDELPLVDADLSISREIPQFDSHTMVMIPFYAYHNSVFASPAYLDTHPDIASPEQLAQHCCLVYPDNRSPKRWEFTTDTVNLSNTIEMNSAETMISAAKNDWGLIYLPEVILQEELNQEQLRPVLPALRSHPYRTCMYYLKADFVPKKVRALVDFLKEQ